jgi:hypothetical protein
MNSVWLRREFVERFAPADTNASAGSPSRRNGESRFAMIRDQVDQVSCAAF